MWKKIPGGRHNVVTDGLSFRKFPFDESKGAQELVQRDADVLRFLNVRVDDIYDEDGKLGFETPKLGFPIEEIDTNKALRQLEKISEQGYPKQLDLNWVGDWSTIVRKRIVDAITDVKAQKLLVDLIPRVFPVSKDECNVLCHTDVHSKNWLLDRFNNYFLIDWEYAVYGTSDVDIACLAFALASDERVEDALNIRKFVSSEYVWDWVVRVKTVSTAGWVWSSRGKWSDIHEKIHIVESLCFNDTTHPLL